MKNFLVKVNSLRQLYITISLIFCCSALYASGPAVPWFDPNIAFETRARLLVSKMTLSEKVDQMQYIAPAIERLHVPAYNWCSEALHGVACNNDVTVFPQAIGLAATFNPDLHRRIAAAISTEARVIYYRALKRNQNHLRFVGLTLWAPNINIFRDPRWGRGQETYGEDPYLTSRFGVAYVRGLQGDDPRYLKAIATPKHYAVHSGPEPVRHKFDASVNLHDLWDTYLPAFEACVREAHCGSIMTAYNRINGQPASSSSLLMEDILYGKWGFQGYAVSDCDAIGDIFKNHLYAPNFQTASAISVKAGCNLNCGNSYGMLTRAVQENLITESLIDQAVSALMLARLRLGMFDPQQMVPYSKIPESELNCSAHNELALQAARQSIVLLKNKKHFLPLNRDINTLAVIGPNADSIDVLLGNYNGTPSKPVTILEGIKRAVSSGTTVLYAKGCSIIDTDSASDSNKPGPDFEAALAAAEKSDAIVLVLGISPRLEGEEMPVEHAGFKGGDRTSLDLPLSQQKLMEAVYNTGKPVVLVLTSGSALGLKWAHKHIPAILQAWYPGQQGGNAVADVLFGDCNPAGRLPITFYESLADLPAFEDYSMANRTYRYFKGKALFPFGYGLSYTEFDYRKFKIKHDGKNLKVAVDVKNTGKCDGDEVVQVYISPIKPTACDPVRALRAFRRIFIPAAQTRTVEFTLSPGDLMFVDVQGNRIIPEQGIIIGIGPNSNELITKCYEFN